MATNNIPVLLLSATCRPVAVAAITTSLMLQPRDINMIDGELTRPELRLIRITMQSTLSSCDDLLRIFAPCSFTSAADSVPMIIYSGTRNRTFQVMKVVNEAWNTRNHQYDPIDGFIRRYHSVTSDEDKLRVMDDFGAGRVPVISATMALGLGQNLKRVRCVVHMGRGDPAAIGQMVGRCGRDGNIGLGLLFMEPTRKNGRNLATDFGRGLEQDDDARMDALAVTKVCLRIALNIDNKLGYIPLEPDDPRVMEERLREIRLGFAKCKCSSCAPDEANSLMKVIQQMTILNFDSMLEDPSSIPKDPTVVTMTRKRKSNGPKGSCAYPKHVAEDLQKHLVHRFEAFYLDHLGPKAEFPPEVFFGLDEAVALVGSIDQIRAGDTNDLKLMERLIGGQCFDGQMASLDQAITDWTQSDYYQQHLNILTDLDRFIESEGIRVRMEMAAGLLALQEAAASRRQSENDAKAKAKTHAKTQAAAARTTARLLRATDLALERARLQSEKAAQKKAKEEERLANLRSQAQARAVAKAAQTAQRAAEKASREAMKGRKQRIGPQDRAGKKTARQERLAQNLARRHESLADHERPVNMISHDTTMVNDTRDELEQDVPGDDQTFRRAIGPAGNIEDIENHTRAARMARAETNRQKNQANLNTPKAHWVGPPTIRHMRSKGQTRSQPNVSRVLHSQVSVSGMEGMRADLQSGGVQGLGNSPFHISSEEPSAFEELSLTS
ncbi:hypothetical protein PGT21_015904 [Puccinia graminis f. sp. tritici]|uniref:DNA 3'-5' helicase n=1 Tax=Puccinia graminis f. sp. tritici TaxID=56615 RepID=A0A5B0MC63_PUCGR|nr:hypothetical protein PGT21_015904 [Puccinia graminis f. sp. tritici]